MKLNETEKENIAHYYCDNNLKRLKNLCHNLLKAKRISPTDMNYDDLLSDALKTLNESLNTYDTAKKCTFHTYLFGNVKRSFYDWTRDNFREKRTNYARDSNGKIILDKNGKKTFINTLSLNAKVDKSNEISEIISSNFDVDRELFGADVSERFLKYLDSLSKIQRKVAWLLIQGYKSSEIMQILNITQHKFEDIKLGLKSYENIKILF